MTNPIPINNGTVVLERVRTALTEAEEAGRPRPGRPALVTLTGASEHQVRRALEALETPREVAGDHQPRQLASQSAGGLQLVAVGDQLETPALAAGEQLAAGTASATTSSTSAPAPGGRLVAWAGFVFGSLMSIAANVLHTWLPAADMPAGWTPGIAPQVGAAVWPVALLLSVEVLSRVRWRRGWWWNLARYGGAGAVTLGSAVISYGHLKEVLLAWGYGHPGADVGPLVLDGLMVVSGFALLAMSRHQANAQTA